MSEATSEPAPAMPRAHRAYLMAMCAIIGGMFAYAACDWGDWARLRILPLSGEITFAPTAKISIVYLGNCLWGLGGALCGAAVGALLSRAVPRTWADRTLHLFGAWAITAILLAGGYFTWSLWPW